MISKISCSHVRSFPVSQPKKHEVFIIAMEKLAGALGPASNSLQKTSLLVVKMNSKYHDKRKFVEYLFLSLHLCYHRCLMTFYEHCRIFDRFFCRGIKARF